MSAVSEKEKAFHLKKMRTRVKRIDVNKDGNLSREDFQLMAEKLIYGSTMSADQAESTRRAFLKVADAIGLTSGKITPLKEAAEMISNNILSLPREKGKVLLYEHQPAIFHALDTNKDGHISLEEFKNYFHVVGPDISDEEITRSFDTIDANSNGEISFPEFLAAAEEFFFGLKETALGNAFFGHLLP